MNMYEIFKGRNFNFEEIVFQCATVKSHLNVANLNKVNKKTYSISHLERVFLL